MSLLSGLKKLSLRNFTEAKQVSSWRNFTGQWAFNETLVHGGNDFAQSHYIKWLGDWFFLKLPDIFHWHPNTQLLLGFCNDNDHGQWEETGRHGRVWASNLELGVWSFHHFRVDRSNSRLNRRRHSNQVRVSTQGHTLVVKLAAKGS